MGSNRVVGHGFGKRIADKPTLCREGLLTANGRPEIGSPKWITSVAGRGLGVECPAAGAAGARCLRAGSHAFRIADRGRCSKQPGMISTAPSLHPVAYNLVVSVCRFIPDRSKIDEDHGAENRQSFQYAEGAVDAGAMGRANNRPYAMNAA
jgi:hypothetical protein